jgi:hypothetical protein
MLKNNDGCNDERDASDLRLLKMDDLADKELDGILLFN